MATIVYTLISMATFNCVARPEISPCTCATHENNPNVIKITCENVSSFNQVVDAIQNKINPDLNIWLAISHSQLEDLETRTFSDMNIKIKNLRLNFDQIRVLPESSFRNLSHIEFFSLADNQLEEIPRRILNHMPNLGTADFSRGNIRRIYADDFRMLKHVKYLLLVSNNIDILEKDSIPKTVMYLHLGRNNLSSINGTLRDLEQLVVIFLNHNNLTTLDNELPIRSKNLTTILAHHNKLTKLPQDLKEFPLLDALYVNHNELKSLDGLLKHALFLHALVANSNKIEYLAEDEFLGARNLETLDLSNNLIQSINGSLLPMKLLRICNISGNNLSEFSLSDIRGLKDLRVLDLSFNKIEKLTGRMENIVNSDWYVNDLRLEHNLIKSLDGAMMGLNGLHTLSLAHNLLEGLSPDDLIGLEDLEVLNVSHNNLQTLEETSKTFLPKLQRLDASFNNLTKLERDFHGLPVLCLADLSNNRITSISPQLVAKTRCSSHGVVNKLEILLQENPILCQDELTELTGLMEAQETRLLGVAHCIVPVPKDDIPINPLSFVPQQLPAPMIPTNIINSQIFPKSILQSPPAIVQVILPESILSQPVPNKENEFTEKQETPVISPISTTTSSPITTDPTVSKESLEPSLQLIKSVSELPAIETIIASISTEPAIVSSSTTPSTSNFELNATANEIDNAVNLPSGTLQNFTVDTQVPFIVTTPIVPAITIVLEQQSVEVTTLSTTTATVIAKENSSNQSSSVLPLQTNATPILAVPTAIAEQSLNEQDTEASASAPESDNYVYETFSAVPQVFGPMSDRTQGQPVVIVEEPPEMLKDGVDP